MGSFFRLGFLALLALSASACTPDIGGQDYSVSDSGKLSQTFPGSIVRKRAIRIDNRSAEEQGRPGVGALGGGVAGGVLGSTIGAGKGSKIATVGGALGGAVLGNYIENQVSKQDGFEYTINLDDGRTISIAQGKEPQLQVGQRVLVIQGSKRTRVVPE